MRLFLSIFWLAFAVLSSSIIHAKVLSITSSSNLITGENCYVTYVIESPTSPPMRTEIAVKDALFELFDTNIISQQGKRYYHFTYRFNSPNAGTFTIPATTFTANPADISEAVTLSVRDKNSLKKHTVDSLAMDGANSKGIVRKTYPYYTQLIAEKSTLFPNEVTQLEFKIYLPKSINVAQWGLPSGEKKNATAWRFETPDPRARNGDAEIDGVNYQVGRFHTTVSGIKAGKAQMGPFKARVVHAASMINHLGSFIETQEIFPVSETLELDILSLPPNPPKDFRGDVGNFTMSVNIESKNELNTSESIKAEVTLTGRGKFSELTPPSLTDDKHWKLISQTKRDLGEMRKSINAFAEFTYLIQPASTSPAGLISTPGFSFSFLDPELKAYRTLSAPGVPVTIKLTPSVIDENETSVDIPTDTSSQMLGIIKGTEFNQKPWFKNIPLWFIHIIPGALCLLLLIKLALQKRQAYRLRKSYNIIRLQSITELEKKDGEAFIKSACNYIQRWLNIDDHPELREIPQLRDDHCYKPDEPITISAKHKSTIIAALKKLSILLFFICPNISDASAEKDWENGNYTEALTQYKSQLPSDSADLLYNIASCYHKLNQPGHAAIYYHRALLSDPYHSRAKHNLSLLQKQNDSITTKSLIQSGSIQDWISIFSLTTYQIVLSLSLWLILIIFMWLKIVRPQINTNFIISLIMIALITTFVSGFSYYKHPDKEKITGLPFAVIAKSNSLTEQPIAESERITTATAASECHILSSRGTYSYIELANHTKGWIRTEDLLRVIE